MHLLLFRLAANLLLESLLFWKSTSQSFLSLVRTIPHISSHKNTYLGSSVCVNKSAFRLRWCMCCCRLLPLVVSCHDDVRDGSKLMAHFSSTSAKRKCKTNLLTSIPVLAGESKIKKGSVKHHRTMHAWFIRVTLSEVFSFSHTNNNYQHKSDHLPLSITYYSLHYLFILSSCWV